MRVETDAKGRKQIDVSELTRVYGPLNPERAEPVTAPPEKPSMNGNDTPTLPVLAANDSRVIALWEGQVQDLKAQLLQATTEKSEWLTLANNYQKQNEVLMLPPPREKHGWGSRLKSIFNTRRKDPQNA